MEDRQKHSIEELNKIVRILEDGKEGYKTAAKDIEPGEVQTMFNLYAQQRGDFAARLTNEIRELGGEPAQGDEPKGQLHRIWMNLRSAVSGNNKKTIFEECERGEKAALDEYTEVMSNDIPHYLKETLQDQREEIMNNLKMIRKLKERSEQYQ